MSDGCDENITSLHMGDIKNHLSGIFMPLFSCLSFKYFCLVDLYDVLDGGRGQTRDTLHVFPPRVAS